MKRNLFYLATPCCMRMCVYPGLSCKGCEYATDDLSVLFEDKGLNILCFL